MQLVAYPLAEDGSPQTTTSTVLFRQPQSAQCETARTHLSPHHHYLVLQYRCVERSLAQLLNLTTNPITAVVLPAHRFLSWSPDGEWLLMRDADTREILLVSADGTETIPLALPGGSYSAVFTPDGQKIVYASSRGLGFGSELGLFDPVTGASTIWQTLPDWLVIFPTWSPDGQNLAYILRPDSNVAFATGALWLADAQGQPIRRLAEGVDTGHGYAPLWSDNGNKIIYVHRDNPEMIEADYDAEALHSNLYRVNIHSGVSAPVTHFHQTRVYEPAWLPGRNVLTFTANNRVWVSRAGASPVALPIAATTQGHPLWFALPQ